MERLSNQEVDVYLTEAFHRLQEAKETVDRLLYERHRRILGRGAVQLELDFREKA